MLRQLPLALNKSILSEFQMPVALIKTLPNNVLMAASDAIIDPDSKTAALAVCLAWGLPPSKPGMVVLQGSHQARQVRDISVW